MGENADPNYAQQCNNLADGIEASLAASGYVTLDSTDWTLVLAALRGWLRDLIAPAALTSGDMEEVKRLSRLVLAVGNAAWTMMDDAGVDEIDDKTSVLDVFTCDREALDAAFEACEAEPKVEDEYDRVAWVNVRDKLEAALGRSTAIRNRLAAASSAREDALKEALKPFAEAWTACEDIGEQGGGFVSDEDRAWVAANFKGGAYPLFVFGDLRRAHDALKADPTPGVPEQTGGVGSVTALRAMLEETSAWINTLEIPVWGATSQMMRIYDLLHGKPFRTRAFNWDDPSPPPHQDGTQGDGGERG